MWRDEPVAPIEDRLPIARDFHSAVYVNGRIIIFGGKCKYNKWMVVIHVHISIQK